MPKPWIAYARVSTEEQAVEGVSLAAQVNACQHFLAATAAGAEVEVVDDPGYSGKDMRRPGAARVLDLIGRGAIAGVVVWRLDRITRSLRDLIDLIERCDKGGVALVSVTEQISTQGPMGRFTLHLLGALAQFERESIAQRVKSSMDHLRLQGVFVGGRIAAGLCVELGADGKRRLARDPALAPIVAEVWPRILSGETLGQVIDWLTAQGVRHASGRPWSRQRLHKLLGAAGVVGLLVDADTQRRAVAALAARTAPGRAEGDSPTPSPRSSRVWRLASIARCGACGAPLVGYQTRGRHGKAYPYLRCSAKNKDGACAAGDLPAQAWEDAVVEALVRAVTRDDELRHRLLAIRERQRATLDERKARRAALVLERDGMAQRIGRVVDLVADGGAAAAAVRPRLAEMETRAGEIAREIAGLDGDIAAAAISERDAEAMVDLLRDRVAALPGQPPEVQAATLAALVGDARLGPGELTLSVWLPGEPEGFVRARTLAQQRGRPYEPQPGRGRRRYDARPAVNVAFPVSVTRRQDGKALVRLG